MTYLCGLSSGGGGGGGSGSSRSCGHRNILDVEAGLQDSVERYESKSVNGTRLCRPAEPFRLSAPRPLSAWRTSYALKTSRKISSDTPRMLKDHVLGQWARLGSPAMLTRQKAGAGCPIFHGPPSHRLIRNWPESSFPCCSSALPDRSSTQCPSLVKINNPFPQRSLVQTLVFSLAQMSRRSVQVRPAFGHRRKLTLSSPTRSAASRSVSF